MAENLKPIYGYAQYPHMVFFSCENPSIDIAKTIGKNLTALMKPPAALDTCQKLAKGSGVSFGIIQRIKNGEVNITVEKLSKIAAALKRHPAELLIDKVADDDYPQHIPPAQPEVNEPAADRFSVFSPLVTEAIQIMESMTHEQQREALTVLRAYLVTYHRSDQNSTRRAEQ